MTENLGVTVAFSVLFSTHFSVFSMFSRLVTNIQLEHSNYLIPGNLWYYLLRFNERLVEYE